MKYQLDNLVLESVKEFVTNRLLVTGEAYTNTSSRFYPVNPNTQGVVAYAAPYQPFVYDQSIPGAIVPTGIYINGVFVGTGVSGFIGYNYQKGQALFTSTVNGIVSGSYSVADYSLALTSDPEAQILFENKYNLRPKVGQPLGPIKDYEKTYPIIYLKNNGGVNNPFSFGGLDESELDIRLPIMADTQFLLDATSSILRDLRYCNISLLTTGDLPFNQLGTYVSGGYNYEVIKSRHLQPEIFVKEAFINKIDQNIKVDSDILPKDVFLGIAELTLSIVRNPGRRL